MTDRMFLVIITVLVAVPVLLMLLFPGSVQSSGSSSSCGVSAFDGQVHCVVTP